jgi:hypothetical protein
MAEKMTEADIFGFVPARHQNQLPPVANKFHVGNGDDGKHYWLTPPELYAELDAEFGFDFDPCPFPLPSGFDGLTCEWGASNYVNPPFGSIVHQGKKKGPTAWVRKAIEEHRKGKTVVLVYPIDKWVLMLLRRDPRRARTGAQPRRREMAGDRGRIHRQGHRPPHRLLHPGRPFRSRFYRRHRCRIAGGKSLSSPAIAAARTLRALTRGRARSVSA